MIKIVQSSPPRTGSTLLLNLIHGFLAPDEEVHCKPEDLRNHRLIKTHNIDIMALEKHFHEYKLFFIMSERNDKKLKLLINSEYKQKPNVLVINYNYLLQTDKNTMKNIVDYTFNKFNQFIPKELKPKKPDVLIKQDMMQRFRTVNATVELMKNEPFTKWDKFTGIHGSHRKR